MCFFDGPVKYYKNIGDRNVCTTNSYYLDAIYGVTTIKIIPDPEMKAIRKAYPL